MGEIDASFQSYNLHTAGCNVVFVELPSYLYSTQTSQTWLTFINEDLQVAVHSKIEGGKRSHTVYKHLTPADIQFIVLDAPLDSRMCTVLNIVESGLYLKLFCYFLFPRSKDESLLLCTGNLLVGFFLTKMLLLTN